MATRQTENSLIENEIRNIAYSTYLHRDAVLDEIASIDCFLRSHDRCRIDATSPIYDIARLLASLGNQSIFPTDYGFSVSIYGLATISGLANRYINTYCYFDSEYSYRYEHNGICTPRPNNTKDEQPTTRYSVKSINNHRTGIRPKHSFVRSLILFFRRIARRFHLFSNNKSEKTL